MNAYTDATQAPPAPVANRWTSSVLMIIMAVLSAWAATTYPGSLSLFTLFCATSMALVWLMLVRPSGFFILFFVSFLTLGCWAKLVFHFIIGNRLVEPIGPFDDRAVSWDMALVVLIISFATMLACLGLLAIRRRTPSMEPTTDSRTPLLGVLLALASVMTAALLAFNFHYNILKIGTAPSLQLNSYVYVVIAFMVAWGNTILLATLGFWMVKEQRLSPVLLFVLLNVEGCLAAISMGSRAQMILHAAVPFAVYFLLGARLNWQLKRRDWLTILPITLILFVTSIVAVSADRLASFATAVPVQKSAGVIQASSSAAAKQPLVNSNVASVQSAVTPKVIVPKAAAAPVSPEMRIIQWKGVMYQLSRLVVDRWIGLEGVLAVTANHAQLDQALFAKGLREDPNLGTAAIYQVMSGSKYEAFENFTFMTIPGPIAVLYYSGSLVVVAAGIAVLLLAGFIIELIAEKTLRNPPASAAIGMAMAYLIVQTNFPKALWFFMLELTLFVVGLIILQRLLALLRGKQR